MWEYRYIEDMSLAGLVKQANALGREGWEAVNFNTTKQGIIGFGQHIMLLKRHVGSAKSAARF